MTSTNNSLVSITATLLFTLCLTVSLFSRNMGEYFFDIIVIFILLITFRKQAPWTWQNLYYDTGIHKWLYAFYFWMFLTLILNPPFEPKSFSTLLEFLWIPALPFFARILSLWRPGRTFLVIFTSITTVSMIAIITHYFLKPEHPEFFGYPNRIQGTFTNINFLAHSYFLVFLLLLGLLVANIQNKQRHLSLLVGAALLTVFITLFLTFTRTIWIAILISIPIMFFIVNKKLALRIFVSLCLLFSVLFISDIGGTRNRVQQTLTTNSGDAIRLTLWRTSLKIFRDNPLIGVGYMNNKRDIMKYFEKYGEKDVTLEFDTHTHNEILSFMAGTGIVGTILYVGNFILFFVLGMKILKVVPISDIVKRGLLLGAVTIQPAFLIAGIADNNFEIHAARNWLVISWAILIWLATENNIKINLRFWVRS